MKEIREFKDQYRFLSNFWPASVEYDGVVYPSVESAYQAAKTLDLPARRQFEDCAPSSAKRRGSRLVLRPDWEDVKLEVMTELVTKKFSCNSELREKLLATEDALLIEGNWWEDTFWGVSPVRSNKGTNWLGMILMEVRDMLRMGTVP